MVVSDIYELIGNTPMLKLRTKNKNVNLFLKLEKFNATGSRKDRTALSMVLDAEKRGILKPGGTIIESTSGNTGAGLALVSAARGYKFIAVVTSRAGGHNLDLIRAIGGRIESVPGSRDRIERALALEKEIPNAVFMKQFDNPANTAAYKQMADEIWEQTDGKIDFFIGAVGTGGSISGTSKRLRELNKNIKVYGVEPVGSPIFGGELKNWLQGGSGWSAGNPLPKNIDFSMIDQGFKVSDQQAITTTRFLARRGILVGGTSGANVWQAVASFKDAIDPVTIVVDCIDGGEKYLNTVHNDSWVIQNNLFDPRVTTELNDFFA
jgi:cystathionine beta-synthase